MIPGPLNHRSLMQLNVIINRGINVAFEHIILLQDVKTKFHIKSQQMNIHQLFVLVALPVLDVLYVPTFHKQSFE